MKASIELWIRILILANIAVLVVLLSVLVLDRVNGPLPGHPAQAIDVRLACTSSTERLV